MTNLLFGNKKYLKILLLFFAVLIEKLLRSCDVENIYILIRSKKDDDIHTRLGKIFDDPVSNKSLDLKRLRTKKLLDNTSPPIQCMIIC